MAVRIALAAALLTLLATAAPAAAQMPGGAPQSPPGALHRYYNPSTGTHWVTPTPVSSGYAYEFSLGYLQTTPGPGRSAIYGCRAGTADHYLSRDPGCEGYTRLGLYGWVEDDRPAAPSVPLYRCLVPGVDHFASNDAGCEGKTSEGRLGYLRLRQPALARYVAGSHWVTSGPAGAGWSLEAVLGFLLEGDGPGRRALYECRSGGDYFLSLDPGCEGYSELGLSGYLYASPPGTEDVVPVYRCRIGGDHFASRDAGCEGQVQEGLLGYLRRTQELLNRAYNPSTGNHWVTTGAIGPGWFFEFALGYVLTRDGGDRAPFYGCLNGASDHFLSLDPGCEGRTALGREGWLYRDVGAERAAVHRCTFPGSHFASGDPACEGTTPEGRLGFVRTAGPEPPPPPPEPLRLTCAPSAATVTASLRGKRVRRVRYGGSSRVTGRVRNGDGSPAAGVPVSILIGNRRPISLGEATTGPRGRYSFRVRPGKNRIIHAGFRPSPGALDLACSRRVRLNVRAGLKLRARPRRVPVGGRVRFRGRLLGKPIPRVGKLIDLQAHDAGKWRTFQTVRANRKGRFRARYRFVRTRSARTFRFRARARREARYPYALGRSRVVRVRVR